MGAVHCKQSINFGGRGGNDKFGKVFISPDRSEEERKVRKQLVDKLKEMVKRSPGTHYIIRGNRVLEAPRDN